MSKDKNSLGAPTFLISKEEKALQESIRQSETQPSATPVAGARNAGKPTEPHEGPGWHSGRKTPKPSVVTTVDADANKNAAIKAADRQNHSDEKYGKDGLNQPPAGRSRPTTTSSGN